MVVQMRSTVPGRVSRIPTNELTSNSKNFVDLAEEPFVGFVQLTSQKNKIFTKLATTPEKARLEITNFVATPTDVAFFGITRNIPPDHRMEKYFQSLRTWRRHLKRLAWK